MWRRSLPLRRRVALLICPELREARVARAAARDALDILPPSPELTARVLRLGRMWLAAKGTESFIEAVGLQLCPPGKAPHGGCRPRAPLRTIAFQRQAHYRMLEKRPEIEVRPKTYRVCLAFFSDHWPASLPWPPDIPRPPKSTEEIAS